MDLTRFSTTARITNDAYEVCSTYSGMDDQRISDRFAKDCPIYHNGSATYCSFLPYFGAIFSIKLAPTLADSSHVFCLDQKCSLGPVVFKLL